MSSLRDFKLFYSIYNFLHQSKLQGRKELYRKYGVKKKIWQSIQYRDFEKTEEGIPWLDHKNSATELAKHALFADLQESWKSSLLEWSNQGYAILDAFYSEKEVDQILSYSAEVIDGGRVATRSRNKHFNAIHHSEALKSVFTDPKILGILEMLLGAELKLFQSLNFYQGSQQNAHSDLIHMTTHPLGYLVAIWVALEDIEEDSGPLFYYPGSHKHPFMSTDDFCENHPWKLDRERHRKYEKKVQDLIVEEEMKPKTLLAKKGDVLIWHANLLHGGHAIQNPNSSRKSIVLHYFAPKAICYHEISHRPALM